MSDQLPEIIPPEKKTAIDIQRAALEQQDYNDRELARMNMIDVSKEALKAVQDLAQFASQAQHPKHYESLAKLIEAATKANQTILDMQISRKKMEIEMDNHTNNPGGPAHVTNHNNVIFQGTAQDLLKMLRGDNNEV